MKKEDIPAGVVRKVAWRLHPATTSPNDAVAGTASGVATRAASRLAALGAVTNSPAGPAEDFPAAMPSGESSDAPLHDAATQAADAGDMEVAHVGPSRADDPPAIPLPAADEAARVAAGTDVPMAGSTVPSRSISFYGMPIAHWRDVPTIREFLAHQRGLPRSERSTEYGISMLLTSPEPSDPEEDSEEGL